MTAPSLDLPGLGKASAGWAVAALVRAVKTFAQSVAGVLTGLAAFAAVDWKVVLSGAGMAALLSLLQSVGGLPETPHGSAPLQQAPTPATTAWPVSAPAADADPYAVEDGERGRHRAAGPVWPTEEQSQP